MKETSVVVFGLSSIHRSWDSKSFGVRKIRLFDLWLIQAIEKGWDSHTLTVANLR